jgi:hypothetical protein
MRPGEPVRARVGDVNSTGHDGHAFVARTRVDSRPLALGVKL